MNQRPILAQFKLPSFDEAQLLRTLALRAYYSHDVWAKSLGVRLFELIACSNLFEHLFVRTLPVSQRPLASENFPDVLIRLGELLRILSRTTGHAPLVKALLLAKNETIESHRDYLRVMRIMNPKV